MLTGEQPNGEQPNGVQNGRSKWNLGRIRFIQLSNQPIAQLAKRFEVDPSVIKDIKLRKTWQHVK